MESATLGYTTYSKLLCLGYQRQVRELVKMISRLDFSAPANRSGHDRRRGVPGKVGLGLSSSRWQHKQSQSRY